MTRSARSPGSRCRHLLPLALACLLALPARADSSAASQLAPIIARILSYERTLAERAGSSVDVVVLYDKDDARSLEQARAFESAFRALAGTTVQGLPLRVQSVPHGGSALESALAASGDVVLVCAGLEGVLADIAVHARKRHALTVGVTREHVASATSLAVIIEEERPKIVVNLAHASAEGVQLSAQLLRRSEIL